MNPFFSCTLMVSDFLRMIFGYPGGALGAMYEKEWGFPCAGAMWEGPRPSPRKTLGFPDFLKRCRWGNPWWQRWFCLFLKDLTRPKQSSTYNYVVKLLYIGLFKISPGIPVPEIRFCFSHIVISPAQPSEGVKRGFWAQHLESKLNLSTVWRKVLYLNDTWNKLHSYCRKFFLKAGTKQMQ